MHYKALIGMFCFEIDFNNDWFFNNADVKLLSIRLSGYFKVILKYPGHVVSSQVYEV